jgi:hypothetical protein
MSQSQKAVERSEVEPNGRRVGAIEVGQDLPFLQRAWKVQRVGWVVMLLIAMAAVLGLFGRGPLASATVGEPGASLRMEYDRFTRHASPTRLKVLLAAGAAEGDKARVWVDREYLQGVDIEQIIPEPESVSAAGEGLIYVFPIADPERPTAILFSIKPDDFGYRSGAIGLADGPRLRFSQLVFP